MARAINSPLRAAAGGRRRAFVACAVLSVALAAPTHLAAARPAGVVASARACTSSGTPGPDELTGTRHADVLCGRGGADRIRGQGGRDVLLGAGGDDLLEGKKGADRLQGGGNDDTAYGGAGADDLRGGRGDDRLGGGLGPDELSGGPGQDVVFYGQRAGKVRVSIGKGANDGVAGEHDNVHGDVEDVRSGRGKDVLTGNGASNELFGGGGGDRLRGKGGSDVLMAGGGDDRIDAREGAAATARQGPAGSVDRVVCGPGEDTALIDPGDVVEPDCEHVIGGTSPPANNPPTGITLSNASVSENKPIGTTVGTLSASDPDPGDTHSFALVPGAGSTDNGSFQIVGSTLQTAAVFNYEAKNSYSVRIRATDHGTPAGQIVRTFTITVTDVNDPPTAVNDSATVAEDAIATPINVLANDTDTDGGPKTIASASDPANGTVVLTGGSPGAHTGLTYQPDPNYCNDPPGTTPDTFTYTLNGGSTATVSVTVTCADDLPTAVDDAATVPEDSAATPLAVLANDTDPDGGPKTIASASDPANGTVVLTGLPGAWTGLTYQPDPSYCNSPPGTTPDTFTYTLTGGSTATVSVTVTCGDDPPTAVDDTATVGEDSGATAIDVLANDTDTDGGPKTIASASDPTNGTVVLTGGSPGAHTGLTYQPDPNYCNDPPGTTPDTFTYTLNGGSTATVSVTVTCVDDLPTAVDDSATVAEDSAAGAIAVLANDTDADGGPKTIASASDPANGTVVLTGGSPGAHTGLTYQPDPDYCNDPPGTPPDTFTYTLNGGSTATVSVTVTCVDDPPAAVDDAATVPEDSAATPIDVLANDTDPDGGPKVIASASDPANGIVVLTGGLPGAHTGLTYQPDPSYCNDAPGTTPDTFTYALNGGSTATVSVTVTCDDDPPTAVNDTATVGEDSGASAIDVLANDTDTDGGPKTIASASDPANGTIVLTGGSPGAHTGLTYQPDPNYCNSPPGTTPDTFTYTLNGGSTATVSVTVTCADDPPTAVNDSSTVAEDAGASAIDVLANDTDPDGGPKVIASASDPANGTVVLTGGSPGAHAGLTYQPDPNYCNDPPGTTPDTFTYTLNGGSTATVSVTVTCAPDNPVVDTSPGTTSYTENAAATPIDAAVTVTDPDAGTTITGATIQITGNYAGAEDILALAGSHPGIMAAFAGDTLTLTGDASVAAYQAALRDVTYRNTSDNPSTATRTVTFTVTDATSRTGSDTKDITVIATDDPPTAVNDSATTLEDAAATAIPVLTNDTDVDGGPKTITSASDPANGTVVVTGGGTGLTYQPDPNYCNDPPGTTPDTFTYTLNGGSNATVSITVTCVNDAPVADDETFNAANSAVGNTTLAVNDPDDGAPPTPDPTDTAPVTDRPHKTISGDILAGDTDVDGPGLLTVTPGTFATNDGGTVTLQADGDFTFEPAASTSCTDTSDFFDYTVSDQNATGPGPTPGTDTGRVTIAITGCVWYVNNDDAQGNSGTSEKPFDTLAQAETASAAGHTIFVYDGNNTTSGYSAGINLKANQKLIGEAAALTVGSDTLHTADAANKPTITDNNADVIDLDDNNEVRGFNIDPQGTGGGIAGSTGDTGGGTIDDVNIVDTGTAGTQPGLELDATTGTFNISNLTVSTNGATGVRLNSAGTVNFASAGTISITSSGAAGLIALAGATGTSMGTSVFDTITVTGSGSGGVNLTNTTGTTTFGDLALTTTTGATPAFLLSNAGTVSVPAAGTADASATGGPAVDVTGTTVSTLAFDAVSSTNSANDGINLTGLGTGTFSAASGTIGGATGIAFDLDGGSGTVTYPGTITDGSGASAEITNRTGGTVTLSGSITDANDPGGGITLTSNTGGTMNFTGGMTLSTGASAALAATGGGTVNVTGTNTLTTSTGTALSVTSTTIGDNDLTFQSISSNGAANGIVLSNTSSANGRLFVTSTGSGTCQTGSTGGCSGGVVQSSTGAGISLSSVPGGAEFTRVAVSGGGDDGIFANGVAGGIRLSSSAILTNGNAVTESGLDYNNVQGITTIQSSDVIGAGDFAARLANTSGTLNLTINDTDFNDAAIDDGLQLLSDGTSVMRSNITGNRFSNNHGDGFQHGSAAAAPNASSDTTFKNNTITGSASTSIDGGIVYGPDGSSRGDISNNTITSPSVSALIINSPPAGAATADFNAIVNANTIGNGTADSGSVDGDGLQVKSPSDGNSKISVTNNVIRNYDKNGMLLRASESSAGPANTQLTATGNQISLPDLAHWETGILLQAGSLSTDVMSMCADVGSNTFTAPATAYGAQVIGNFWLSLRFPNAVMKVPNYTGTTFANRQSYFLNRNTGFNGGTAGFQYVEDGSQNMQNNGNPGLCTQPTAPTLPTAP